MIKIPLMVMTTFKKTMLAKGLAFMVAAAARRFSHLALLSRRGERTPSVHLTRRVSL
jgi:hypothetical protein